MMRLKTLIIVLFLAGTAFGQSQAKFFDNADVFFKTFTKDGRVNYDAIKAEPKLLNWLVTYLATETIDKRTEKAYLINAYNILVIDKLIKNPKLVDSPLKISGFFENSTATLEGKKVSLNQIENQMIRPVYKDPRVHFVLVCGGLGCPPIASYAYRPEKLDMQMEHQTKLAMNDNAFVYDKADKKSIYISQIFEWYQGDFGSSTKDVVKYINGYRDNAFDEGFKVRYYDYDWTINSGNFSVEPVTLEGLDEMPHKDGVHQPMTGENKNPDGMMKQGMTDNSGAGSTTAAPDDEINLQTFTAGSLLGKGKLDFTLFNTLYTENRNIWQGQEFTGYRSTFVTHLVQVTYGLTESKRINVGLDLNIKNSGTTGFDSSFSAIDRAFTYQNNDSARFGLTSVGLRLKVQPFKNVSNFSFQSTVYTPTVEHPEGFFDTTEAQNHLYWADWNRITWWNQFFIDKTFGDFQVFAELDFLFRFKRNPSQIGMLDMPASVFVSYFPTKKITLYAMTQHLARFTNNINGHDPVVTDWVIPANYTASGLGFKYQFLPNLNLELLYTNFWRGTNSGLGSTFNVGVKFLTR